jgi:hypothetical protein
MEPRGKGAKDRFYDISDQILGGGILLTFVTGNTLWGVRCLR